MSSTLSLHSISGKPPQRFDISQGFFGAARDVDEFEKLNRVGEGTYGVVYRVRDRKSKEIVALKRIRMEQENDGLPLSSLREIMLLKSIRHDNVVLVKEVAVGPDLDSIFMVMEYCEQDMATLMDTLRTRYTPSEVKCLIKQLLEGLGYLHERDIVHRDLKLSNLLLNGHGILKIADFGLARKVSATMTPHVVTLWYRSPELLFGAREYTAAVDLWSVGCILGELILNEPMLPGKVEQEQINMIIRLIGRPHEGIWEGFNLLPLARAFSLPDQQYSRMKVKFKDASPQTIHFLNGLLTYSPRKRLDVMQALVHPYFDEDPKAKDPSMLPTHPEIRNDLASHEREAKEKRQEERDRDKRKRHREDDTLEAQSKRKM